MTHYLKIIFILSSLFLFNSPSLAASRCKPVFSDALPKPQNSIWKIGGPSGGNGSGFFISPNQFVTNFHVVEILLQEGVFDAITVSRDGTHEIFKIKSIQKLSALYDLAVLEIEGETKDYLKLQNKPLSSAKGLFAMSYAKGKFKTIKPSENFIYTPGNSYKLATKYDQDLQGASGSPLLNKAGEVVGVLSTTSYKTINAIKINNLLNLLKKKTKVFLNSNVDTKKELENLKKAARQGYDEAQFELAQAYGDRSKMRDDKLSLHWYEKAAEQGLAEAQHQAARMYNNGIGTAKNESKALYWYKKAARQNFIESQFRLGVMYLSEEGRFKNEKMSFYWFQKTAMQNWAEAQYQVALMYGDGIGTAKNESKSFYWMEKAARQGLAEAQFLLALMYNEGRGRPKNITRAFYWMQRAAKEGLAEAQYQVAQMHDTEIGTSKNERKALHWYEKAAEQGVIEAQYQTAWMYDEGAGTAKNESKSLYWFQKATRQKMVALQKLTNRKQ